MISSKSQYAIKSIIDISLHKNELVKIKDISRRQEISSKYLEQVISLLVKSNLLKSYRGNNGGYTLSKSVEEYNAYEIIIAVDGKIGIDFDDSSLSKFWNEYNSYKRKYLEKIKLTQLIDDYNEYSNSINYCI